MVSVDHLWDVGCHDVDARNLTAHQRWIFRTAFDAIEDAHQKRFLDVRRGHVVHQKLIEQFFQPRVLQVIRREEGAA